MLATTGALSQTVKVNWQTDAPFADYRTYAWKGSKNQGGQFYRQWAERMSTPYSPRRASRE